MLPLLLEEEEGVDATLPSVADGEAAPDPAELLVTPGLEVMSVN